MVVALAVLILGGAAASWWHVAAVVAPDMQSHSPNPSYHSNETSDLYPRWVGVRRATLYHESPYSAEVTAEIQRGYYGTSTLGPEVDQQKFAYPAYFISLFFWAGLLPFSVISVAAWVVLPMLAAIAVVGWSRFVCGQNNFRQEMLWAALALGSWPVAEAVWVQQPILLILATLAAATIFAVRGQAVLAGFFLACCTIKPHLVAAFVSWWLFWALLRWRERRRLVFSFIVTMVILLVSAQLIVPGWWGQWTAGLKDYLSYTDSGFIFQASLGSKLGLWITLLVAVLPLLLAFRLAARPGSEPVAVALVLAATLVASPTHAFGAYNQVLLLPAALVLWRSPTPRNIPGITIRALAWLLLAWGEIGALLTLAFWRLRPVITVPPRIIVDLPLYNFLCLPVVVVLALVQISSSPSLSPDVPDLPLPVAAVAGSLRQDGMGGKE